MEESRPSSEKLEIEDEKSGDYGKQNGKRCQRKFPSEETKVTTILPCLGTSGGIVQRSGDSLESLLDDCLENGKLMNQGEMECAPKPNKPRFKNDISSNQNHENTNVTADSSLSVSNIEAKISSKDAFLCNLPNAPPFILKMNKTSFGTELTSEKEEASKKDCKETCAVKNDISSIMDSLDLDRASHTSSTLYPTNKGYSEMSEHNLFIDNTCPTISNREFRTFLGKSISFIKNSKDILQEPSRGCFMSSPTVCLTGLSGFSISPFTMDEKDSRKRCQSIAYRPSTDILSNETSHQHQSKIPRMLHPGKYKVHTKMKNVQLTSGSKGYGKSQACSSRGCRDHCGAENNDVPITTIHNVANTCTSKTKTCAAANARSEKRGVLLKTGLHRCSLRNPQWEIV
ncbi:hypothetical protein WA026_018069 [Henosepilachna vigintioctopunctata]|uniref:Uncharacterized protein n=1 Tax=Henosepilachna vigintioctopunctata TaxID=420089 RepID=A0AAW1UPH6_9CUCU